MFKFVYSSTGNIQFLELETWSTQILISYLDIFELLIMQKDLPSFIKPTVGKNRTEL